MIKLTRLDGRTLWITKDSITMVEHPDINEWNKNARAIINGAFGVKETPEQVLEMLK